MTYDPDLSIAELERMMILIQHHLRQIRLNRDERTAKVFNTKLGKASYDARQVMKGTQPKKARTVLEPC
jgi:hypothetical protein